MVSSFMFQVSGSISEFSQSETNNLKLETRNSKPETLERDTLCGIERAAWGQAGHEVLGSITRA